MTRARSGRAPGVRVALCTIAVTSTLAGCVVNAPAPAKTVTVTAPAPGEVTPQPTRTSKPERTPEAAPAPQPTAVPESVAPEPELFAVPALVGMNLQDAQDTLQLAGSYVLDQQDASGLERFQVNDSNWYVCSQDPAPGAVVAVDAIVTLASVKLDEVCP